MAAYKDLMQEEAPDPSAMLADKGYDSDAIRDDLERRGADPVIPTKSNRKVQRPVDKTKYAMRNRIERFFNRPSIRAASPPDMTSWPQASSALFRSLRSGSGSGLSTRPRS
jgi:transposase